jgi:hypothetical protein
MKKSVVFQAFARHRPPAFVGRCLASVRAWSARHGHEYRYYGDEILDVLPGWYRDRLDGRIVHQVNLARLHIARDLLANGAERVVWLDADVLVFDPEAFDLDAPEGFAFCREVWLDNDRDGDGYVPTYRVNQAVIVADRGNAFLDYCLWAHERMIRDDAEGVLRSDTSTALLTAIHATTPLPLVTNVAMMTPRLIREIVDGGEQPALREYVRRHAYATQAVNMTLSLVGREYGGAQASADDYDAACATLLATQGAALGLARIYPPSAAPAAQSRGTR